MGPPEEHEPSTEGEVWWNHIRVHLVSHWIQDAGAFGWKLTLPRLTIVLVIFFRFG